MTNVLFNRETLRVTGVGREPLPFEVEIKNVDVTDLKKEVKYTELVNKTKIETLEDGTKVEKQLYLLPQEDKKIITQITKKIETTESTDEHGHPLEPVMIQVKKQVPMLDSNGEQVEYIPTALIETTETVDFYGNPTEPVMIQVEEIDESTGEVTVVEKQKTDENGNLIYFGLVATSNKPIKCFTTELIEEQKKDKDGNLLYYKEIVEEIVNYEKQPPLEITEDDERWPVELDEKGNEMKVKLEKATEEVEKTKIVNFEEDMSQFNYDDVVLHKEKQLIKGTFYSKAKLFERMDESLFSTNLSSFNADLGFDMLSLPVGGEVRTIKLSLPKASSVVGVKLETNIENGVEVKVGATANDLQLVDRNMERIFENEVSEVYISFKNITDKRIDIYSFTLLV